MKVQARRSLSGNRSLNSATTSEGNSVLVLQWRHYRSQVPPYAFTRSHNVRFGCVTERSPSTWRASFFVKSVGWDLREQGTYWTSLERWLRSRRCRCRRSPRRWVPQIRLGAPSVWNDRIMTPRRREGGWLTFSCPWDYYSTFRTSADCSRPPVNLRPPTTRTRQGALSFCRWRNRWGMRTATGNQLQLTRFWTAGAFSSSTSAWATELAQAENRHMFEDTGNTVRIIKCLLLEFM